MNLTFRIIDYGYKFSLPNTFTITDREYWGEVSFDYEPTKRDVIEALVDKGFFKPRINQDQIEVIDCNDGYELFDNHLDGLPYCKLEIV